MASGTDLHTLARQVKRAFASKDWGLALKVLKEEGVTPERCQWAAMIERRFTGGTGITPKKMAEEEQRRRSAIDCRRARSALGFVCFLESPGGRARSRGVPGAGVSDPEHDAEVGGAFVTKLHMRYSATATSRRRTRSPSGPGWTGSSCPGRRWCLTQPTTS